MRNFLTLILIAASLTACASSSGERPRQTYAEAKMEAQQPKRVTKEEFHRIAKVLRPDEYHRRALYGRLVEYKDSAGGTYAERQQAYQNHLESLKAQKFSCQKSYNPRRGPAGNSVVFDMKDKWNYISVICKEGCEGLYYSLGSKRASYFTHKGDHPFPKLLALGTQTLGMTQSVALRFAKLQNGELVSIDENTQIKVIHWKQTFFGVLAGGSCAINY